MAELAALRILTTRGTERSYAVMQLAEKGEGMGEVFLRRCLAYKQLDGQPQTSRDCIYLSF